MNTRQLAQLALGITGIWALVYALSGFIALASVVVFSRDLSPGMAVAVLPSAVLLGVGYVLVFHNAQVAMVVFPQFAANVEADVGGTSAELPALLVALTGLLVFAGSIPGLASSLWNLVATRGFPEARSQGGFIQGLVGRGIEAALGVYLIVRPQRLLDFLRRPAPAESVDVTST